jgi:hypothetical protein
MVFGAGVLLAQRRLLEHDYRIISGSDVGFRVKGKDLTGRPMGRWMVRIEGQWVEAVDNPTARHATH